MNVGFVVLDSDGREKRRGTCNSLVLEDQGGPDETVMLATASHWTDEEGIEHERPLAAPETGAAPLTFVLPVGASVSNEYGERIDLAEGDELTIEDAGEYTLTPAFPYRKQTVTVT